MFDIGWSEMAVIALIALIVIGPKELPNAMRTAAKWARKARSLAREFQSGVDDMIREADLEDAKKAVESARSLDIEKAVEDTVDPTGSIQEEARAIETMARRSDPEEAATGAAESPETASGDDGASPEDGAAPDSGAAAESERATVLRQPVNVAPPHSLRPPEPGDEAATGEPEPAADAPAGEDSSQKSA